MTLDLAAIDVDDGNTSNVLDFVKDALETALGATITDTGRGLGGGNLWFNLDGREYFLEVRPSGNQMQRESN